MVVVDLPQDLSEDEEGELVAYVDGLLPADRRAAVEARAKSDPSYAAALTRQQEGRGAIATAVESTGAPLALRTRVEAMAEAPGRRHGERRRPSARTRLGGIRWPGAGLVAGALAVALAAVVVVGGGPGIEDVAAAAERSPTAEVAQVPPESKVLQERQDQVVFPNFVTKFGWEATGTRTDEIGGRETRTVFYEKDGREIAYTVVGGDALDQPSDADEATVEGTVIRGLEAGGRQIVTWRRNGQTCVLSSTDVPRRELETLAGWKGMGDVEF
jgi:anti-sigma factor RsiW